MAYTIFINIILILSGEEIIHEVKKYTGDLRTGFGSFIEKNLAPMGLGYTLTKRFLFTAVCC